MTRLKIDLYNGILEVEGEEGFVDKIYKDFKDQLASPKISQANPKVTIKKDESDKKPINGSTSTPSNRKTKSTKENYPIIKDLDLSGKDSDGKSLKEFYNEKSPASFTDKNVVFVYYLKKIAKILAVNLSYIFTCYSDVGSRKPNAFKQSIADTSSKNGWLDTSSFENIDVSIRGQNHVEHELPQKVEKTS